MITLRPLRYFAGEEHNVFLDIARLDAMTGRLPLLVERREIADVKGEDRAAFRRGMGEP